MRRGIATTVAQHDTGTGAVGRATTPAAVALSGEPSPPSGATIQIAGPEDVTGVDGRAVARAWPKENTFEAEPNYLAPIELDQPDLPWRTRRR
jgi:hypothetical protein